MRKLDSYITIPQYYQRYCDNNVNLEEVRNIPCKFHNEKHGKSFTYSSAKRVWRCWGECHCGGDVVELHKLNYRLKSREEAEESLASLLGISLEKPKLEKQEVSPNEEIVELNRWIAKAIRKAKTVDECVDLDYIMSQYPTDIQLIKSFCDTH